MYDTSRISEHYDDIIYDYEKEVEKLKDRLKQKTERVSLLTKALKYYAEGEWNGSYPGGVRAPEEDSPDFGDVAKAALKGRTWWLKEKVR